MINLGGMVEAHARASGGERYEGETALQLRGGASIRFRREGTDYVRVCDDDGRELMYWHEQEFTEDFATAMGNFLTLCVRAVEATGANRRGG